MYIFGLPEIIVIILVIIFPLFVLLLIIYTIVNLLLHRNKTVRPVQEFFQFEEAHIDEKK